MNSLLRYVGTLCRSKEDSLWFYMARKMARKKIASNGQVCLQMGVIVLRLHMLLIAVSWEQVGGNKFLYLSTWHLLLCPFSIHKCKKVDSYFLLLSFPLYEIQSIYLTFTTDNPYYRLLFCYKFLYIIYRQYIISIGNLSFGNPSCSLWSWNMV